MTNPGGHLIIGGSGMIGSVLQQRLKLAQQQVIATSRHASAPDHLQLDLEDPDAVERFVLPSGISRVYLLAAVTSLKTCREDEARSRRINVVQIGELAKRAADCGAVPVLVSTNLVFDGTEPFRKTEDTPNANTAYGKQKAKAEQIIRSLGGVIIRPGKIIPPFPGPAMLSNWCEALQAGESIRAFVDLMMAPVSLATVLDSLVHASPGITHLSASSDVSYFHVAQHIAKHLGADPNLVEAASAAQAGIPAAERPPHTTLACEKPADPWQVIDEALGFDHADRRA